jgi:hypothetical protein
MTYGAAANTKPPSRHGHRLASYFEPKPWIVRERFDGSRDREEVSIDRGDDSGIKLRPNSSRSAPPIGTDEWLFQRTRSRPRVNTRVNTRVNISSVELLNLIYESDEE